MRQAVVDLASQPVTNLLRNPSFEAPLGTEWANSAATSVLVRSLVPSWRGGTALKMAGNAGGSADTYMQYGEYGMTKLTLKPSTTYTLSAYGKVITPGTGVTAGIPRSVSMWWRTPSLAYVSRGGTVIPNVAGAEGRSWVTFTTPPDMDQSFFRLYLGYQDGEIHWDHIMLTEGAELRDYADGSTPGWRWTGAALTSESVGYPYTLESIAGRPVASVTGVGSVSLTLAQMPAMSERTTYVVTDRLVIPGAGIAARFARGVATAGGADFRADGPLGLYTFRPQYDGGAGGGAGGVYGDGYTGSVPAAGTRNVHSAAEMSGLTAFEHEVNGGTPEGRTGMASGVGHSSPGLVTESGALPYESPVFAVQYRGAHSLETRRRVTAWLARRYGSPIPSGY